MCADIFEVEMEVEEQPQSSLMGGVALGMQLLGVIDSIENFSVESAAIIKPIPENSKVYKKRYEEYKKCYGKFFSSIKMIK